jgi:hypothetical protein
LSLTMRTWIIYRALRAVRLQPIMLKARRTIDIVKLFLCTNPEGIKQQVSLVPGDLGECPSLSNYNTLEEQENRTGWSSA